MSITIETMKFVSIGEYLEMHPDGFQIGSMESGRVYESPPLRKALEPMRPSRLIAALIARVK